MKETISVSNKTATMSCHFSQLVLATVLYLTTNTLSVEVNLIIRTNGNVFIQNQGHPSRNSAAAAYGPYLHS